MEILVQQSALGAMVLLLVIASFYDARKFIIPNEIPIAIAAVFIVLAAVSLLPFVWLWHVGAGFTVLVIGLFAMQFRFMGGGDVKLWAAIALWLGFRHLLLHALFVSLAGLVLALVLVAVRQSLALYARRSPEGEVFLEKLPEGFRVGGALPYGIAISVGTLAVLFAAPPEYLRDAVIGILRLVMT